MLQGGMIAPTTHYEEYLAEKQLHDQQQAHNYLKQQIRQTVLTRVGSRGQANQLDEAPETEESEVIDLTGKKDHAEESEISKQQRDREQFLQQQRDLMMRHTLQTSESTVYAGSRSSQSARPLSRALSSPLVHLGKTRGFSSCNLRVSLRLYLSSEIETFCLCRKVPRAVAVAAAAATCLREVPRIDPPLDWLTIRSC